MMNRLASLCLVGFVASGLSAAEVELSLAGRVKFVETDFEMVGHLFTKTWSGTTAKGFTFPQKESVPFSLQKGKETLAHGSATLTSGPNGTARARYDFVSDLDQELQGMILQVTLPVEEVSRASWSCGGKSALFPPTYREMTLFHGKERTFSLQLSNGKRFSWTFPKPVRIQLQDNRRWGVENFSLRLANAGARRYAKGEKIEIDCTIGAEGPVKVSMAKPVVIQEGAEWVALDYRKDILAGSPLDFSAQGFTDAPAGKYGWLKAEKGAFVFEKKPGVAQRFYGVNFCGTANFPDRQEAKWLIERLYRLGYNTIRIHHHDRGCTAGSKDGVTLNAQNMDRLDYMIAEAYQRGMYVTTDLFVSRPVLWRHIGIDRDGQIPMQVFKGLVATYDPAFENWKAFTKNFLLHKNPYTGRRYVDDPGMPLLSLINEGQLTMGWGDQLESGFLHRAWTNWVTETRMKNPKIFDAPGSDALPQNVWHKPSGSFARFLADVERKSSARMIAFVRSLGSKALISNVNCGPHFAPMQEVRTTYYDYVDDHFYVDHPRFLKRPWSLPSQCGNKNPVLSQNLPPCSAAFTRLVEKPFTITEYNFSGPGMYRGVGGILTGAMGALQEWDGLWRFAYAHSIQNAYNGKGTPGYFDVSTDPLSQASDRASLMLFLRGDLHPLTQKTAMLVTPDSMDPARADAVRAAPKWNDAAWQTQVGTTLHAEQPSGTNLYPLDGSTNQPPLRMENRALLFDRAKGTFTICTPRTCGGFVLEGMMEAGPFRCRVTGSPATVWVSSLDQRELSKSDSLLLTHLTDVQGNGTTYADQEKTILLKWGRGAPLMRDGSAEISLALENPASFQVRMVRSDGSVLSETVPTRCEGDRLVFTVQVRGPEGAQMLYHLVRRK